VHAWSHPSWPFASPQAEQGVKIRKVDFSQIAFQAVLVFHDSRDWGRDIQYICDVLRSPNGTIGQLGDDKHQQPFLAFSHGDLIWGNDFSAPRLGQGAFQHALRAVYKQLSGRELQSVTFGKPERLTYEYADILLKEQLASIRSTNTSQEDDVNVYMIGDNPASDIAGANNFGWQSALVSGVHVDRTRQLAHYVIRRYAQGYTGT
jgi:HAD superfamily hydrolase (TIGR01456 family)